MTTEESGKQPVNTAYLAFLQLMKSPEKVIRRHPGPGNPISSPPFALKIRTEPARLLPSPGIYPTRSETGAKPSRPA